MNIEKIERELCIGEAALVLSPENRRYLTGFGSSDGIIVITGSGSKFWTDSRYIEDASEKIKDAEVELLERDYGNIEEFLRDNECRTVLVEASRITVSELERLRNRFTRFEFDTSGRLDEMISGLRAVKTPWEMEELKKAQNIAETSFKEFLPMIRVGIRERDLAAELDYRMRRNGAEGISFDTIVISGENTSKPHGVPGDRRLMKGDFITVDFGAVYNGYHSDTTRTVALGSITPEMEHVYNTVLKAQKTAAEAISPGMTAGEYDAVARKVIEEAGYGEYFGHGTGHGVGIEIHERPFAGRDSEGILRAGNVVSCEPGIYLPGRFGVRIEDTLIVTESGAETLCSLPKELIVLK